MSDYYGDIRLGDTHDFKFTTRQISGAPSTLSSSPVISAYPGNSTTELTAGITLTVDFDSRTGYNNIRVVATSGNGYATATNYDLAITTGTVNSVSVVGESVAAFSIENRSALMPTTAARTLVVDAAGLADANAVKVGPTGSGTAQTAGDIPARLPAALTANGNMKSSLMEILTTALTETAGQLAGGFKKFFNIAAPASTMDALTLVATATTLTNLPAITNNWLTAAGIAANALNGKGDWSTVAPSNLTAAQIATGVWQDATASDFTAALSIGKSVMNGVALGTGLTINGYTGNTPQTGDAYARLGAPAGASVSADIAAIKSDTGGLVTAVAALPTANANADALLGRNVAGGSSTGRLVKEALYVLRNKVDVPNGNVYATDDSTVAWSFVATTAAGNPVTVIDPA